MMLVTRTNSPEKTEALGRRLGRLLGPGDVVALTGDLGAGKTTLTRGIASGAGVADDVFSPTFTLLHEHAGRVPFYHIDLYRIAREEDASLAGMEEYLFGDGIIVVEWAEHAGGLLPDERIEISLVYRGDSEREITVRGTSERTARILEKVLHDADTRD